MSDLLNSEPKGKRWRVSTGVALTAAGILLVAALGVWQVFRFVDDLRERDLRTWQDRLGLVADSRKDAVEAWLTDRKSTRLNSSHTSVSRMPSSA